MWDLLDLGFGTNGKLNDCRLFLIALGPRRPGRNLISLAEALRCRVRCFTAGAVLGSQGFVDEFIARQRDSFGEKRSGGGRRMKGADWGELYVLRDLKEEVISGSG